MYLSDNSKEDTLIKEKLECHIEGGIGAQQAKMQISVKNKLKKKPVNNQHFFLSF